MMPSFVHLEDHIYSCLFRREVIFLDLKDDKYHILGGPLVELLIELLINPYDDNVNGEISQFVQHLRQTGFLKQQSFNYPYPFKIDKKENSAGVFSAAWRLSSDKPSSSLKYQTVFEAFLALSRINFVLKRKKFYGVISLLQKQIKKDFAYTVPPTQEIQRLADELNQACLFYPKKMKCLEWASTFTLLALSRGWKCRLIVGVQNYPFLAHAWAEINEKIVGDNEEFPTDLAIILKEPFREKIDL